MKIGGCAFALQPCFWHIHSMSASGRRASEAGQVRRLLRQQSAIADFGLFTLREPALQPALEKAARLAADGLGCSLAKVLEHLPSENKLLIRAGVGWKPGVVGTATVGADLESPAGFALHTGQPVLSNHLSKENRFRTPAIMAEHGVRRAINVIIRGDGPPFGVLEADSPDPGTFRAEDTVFLQALANTLAIAVERDAARRAEAERQLLQLREIHHRVKNSLQLVRSTLSLQAREQSDAGVRFSLEEAAARVKTIAAVHERLYAGHSLVEVDALEYLQGLIADLRDSLTDGTEGRTIELEAVEADTWPAGAAPALGLVLAELVTNALKYSDGVVRVAYRRFDRAGELVVRDDGPGFPEGFDPQRSRGLGMRMVSAFARAPGGSIAVGPPGRGGCITVRLPKPAGTAAAMPD